MSHSQNLVEISVVVPVYNGEQYLPACIDSLKVQTYTDWELVIVNDGSTTERARTLIDEIADSSSKIIALHQANGGISNARLNGFDLTSDQSEYVLFLDSDDILMPDALEMMRSFLIANPGMPAVSSDDFIIDGNGKIVDNYDTLDRRHHRVITEPNGKVRLLEPSEPDTTASLLTWNGIRTPGCVMIRQNAFQSAKSTFRADLDNIQDWALWIHLSKIGPIGRIDKKLLGYRRHGSNVSGNIRGMLNTVRRFRHEILRSPDFTDREKQACRVGYREIERDGMRDKLRMIVSDLKRAKIGDALRQSKYLAAHGMRFIAGIK